MWQDSARVEIHEGAKLIHESLCHRISVHKIPTALTYFLVADNNIFGCARCYFGLGFNRSSHSLGLLPMRPEPISPSPNQESVWDYPRPPRLEATDKHIRIIFNGELIADTHSAQRILETSHPPNYYIPMADIKVEYLLLSTHSTYCEWKGRAHYYTLQVGDRALVNVAWYYPEITPAYEQLKGYVGFYPGPMDACYVDDEKVKPQAGNFYAGWITQDIVGPFKGEFGTLGW